MGLAWEAAMNSARTVMATWEAPALAWAVMATWEALAWAAMVAWEARAMAVMAAWDTVAWDTVAWEAWSGQRGVGGTASTPRGTPMMERCTASLDPSTACHSVSLMMGMEWATKATEAAAWAAMAMAWAAMAMAWAAMEAAWDLDLEWAGMTTWAVMTTWEA